MLRQPGGVSDRSVIPTLAWEGEAIHSRTELTLTERADPSFAAGVRQAWLDPAAWLLGMAAAIALIAAGMIAAQTSPGFIRIMLAAPFSGVSPVAVAGTGGGAVSRPSDVGMIRARQLNAAVPFAAGAVAAARPFLFAGSASDRQRAVDCLALAAMAEAGASDRGQRAVIQVILNRVRHPAFAKSICGVVFEGSHRSTGCQFTFTCDGALARRYAAAAWSSARARANDALDGLVFDEVGLATHYHTDWVHPYWSQSLMKLARVDTHLFFRWPGRWGSPGFLNASYGGNEPAIRQLAYLPAHADGVPFAPMPEGEVAPAIGPTGNVLVRNEDGGAFILLSGSQSAASVRELGRSICSDRPSCKVLGWFERSSIPSGYPVPGDLRARIGFSYFRGVRNDEIVLFDCTRFSDAAANACLPPSAKTRGMQQASTVVAKAISEDRITTGNDGHT